MNLEMFPMLRLIPEDPYPYMDPAKEIALAVLECECTKARIHLRLNAPRGKKVRKSLNNALKQPTMKS